jgi:hypothetical protein
MIFVKDFLVGILYVTHAKRNVTIVKKSSKDVPNARLRKIMSIVDYAINLYALTVRKIVYIVMNIIAMKTIIVIYVGKL